MRDFVHLHVHSQYSVLDGESKIPNMVRKAIGNGMQGMALTDHGVMFGIKELADCCASVNKKRKAEGLPPFKPIYGCEMYVARHTKADKVQANGDRGGYHLVVLAKNKQGYLHLVKLVSNAWVDGFYGKPRTDRADLEKYHEGLIVCSACIAGEVPSKILKGDIAGAREAIEWYHRVFGDDYYLELQRHEVTDPNLVANRETFPLQQKANGVLVELSREYGIKLVCTNDCHFEDKETAEAHDHLLCISTGKDLDDPNRMRYSKQEWFKTREEMNEVFSDIPEALTNTLEILDKVEMYGIDHGPIMPTFPIPQEFGTVEVLKERVSHEDLLREFSSDEKGENTLSPDKGRKKIETLGGYEKVYRIKLEADYLAKLAYEGARKLYGDPLPEEVRERVNFELHVMKTMGFPGYFLIVSDFIRAAREELGVMVGPGRGSAAGSVVAYCLGITKIDPLKYDLLFERFLNPDRVNLPDIDTDFDDEGRGKVLRWVMDKYGQENCAHIITYATMATKNSIKDVARVEKLPLERSNQLCKAIPAQLPDGPDGKATKMNLDNAIKFVPELRQAEISDNPRESNTIKYARMLEGTIRGTGIHACGFIISRDPIDHWVPVSTADDPDFPGLKTTVTQYDCHVIESTGLIKMDFLGLKTLSELKEAVRVIKQTTGDEIDLDNIPIDDALTFELYQKGNTVGTFQFESPGMRKHLRELHPTVFEDLIAMNALYRPGPMAYIPEFIRRKNDPSLVKYDIPCMEKYLKETYGITVYQEQVMLLSRQLASFTRGESDSLRKAMGKKDKDIVDKMSPKFLEQGAANGHAPKVLKKIWSDWEKFASYAFNKSHATCYSWVSYQTAYLKAHYPAEFMAALMTRRFSEITEITKLMEDCKYNKIATLGPDVNESYTGFGVNERGEIRFGLSAIKGMGESSANAIVEERLKNGPYKDIFDFVQRMDFSLVNRKALEGLALSGGFDCFKVRRERYLAKNAKGEVFLDTLIRYGQKYQTDKAQQSNSLFGMMDSIEIQTPPIPEAESWSTIERLNRERELVGIYLSAHPLDDYRLIFHSLCNTHVDELEDKEALAKKEEIRFGGIITDVRHAFSKRGQPFGIVTLEDYEGVGKLALFAEEWGRWQSKMIVGSAIYATGKSAQRHRDSSYYELVLHSVEYMQTVKEKQIGKFTVTGEWEAFTDGVVEDLLSMLTDCKGNSQLFFNIQDVSRKTSVLLRAKNKISVPQELVRYIDNIPELDYSVNE